jgi:hypothetical protein
LVSIDTSLLDIILAARHRCRHRYGRGRSVILILLQLGSRVCVHAIETQWCTAWLSWLS